MFMSDLEVTVQREIDAPLLAAPHFVVQDPLVGRIDDQTDQDRRQREPRDEQRDDEPHREDRDDDQRVGVSGEHGGRVDRVSNE